MFLGLFLILGFAMVKGEITGAKEEASNYPDLRQSFGNRYREGGYHIKKNAKHL